MALVGVEREALVSEPDALTTRPPPCVKLHTLVDIRCPCHSRNNNSNP